MTKSAWYLLMLAGLVSGIHSSFADSLQEARHTVLNSGCKKESGCLKKSCDSRDAKGCAFLGLTDEDGKGVKQDYIKEVALFKKTVIWKMVQAVFILLPNIHRKKTS